MDEDAFDAFYASSRPRLGGQLTAMTGDAAEAQDVVQEAFVRAWDRRRQLGEVTSPEAWVRTTTWRLAVSRWRRTQAVLRAHRRHGPEADATAPSEDTALLVAALREVPPDQRRVLMLHHPVDLPVEEVAAEVGVAVGTVKSRLSRGRAALARALADDPSDDADALQEAPRG